MTIYEFFEQIPRAALAFSGGVDSSFLMGAARDAGADIHAYMVRSAFQPEFELREARELAAQLDIPLTVIDVDVLADKDISPNPADRCYHCKHRLFGALTAAAHADGFDVILDGTNASDDAGDRPGMRALAEYGVRSPLRECGLTKDDVRAGAKKLGLQCWNKPAYSCLATRIQTGMHLSADLLERVEAAETALFGLGYSDFRVRVRSVDAAHDTPHDTGNAQSASSLSPSGLKAICQFPEDQLERALQEKVNIIRLVGQYFPAVEIDRR